MASLKPNEQWAMVHERSGIVWPGTVEPTKQCLIDEVNKKYGFGAYNKYRRRGYRPGVVRMKVVRVGR